MDTDEKSLQNPAPQQKKKKRQNKNKEQLFDLDLKLFVLNGLSRVEHI